MCWEGAWLEKENTCVLSYNQLTPCVGGFGAPWKTPSPIFPGHEGLLWAVFAETDSLSPAPCQSLLQIKLSNPVDNLLLLLCDSHDLNCCSVTYFSPFAGFASAFSR